MDKSNKPIVAAFDFDGTLTRRDTLLPFLRYLLGDAWLVRHALVLSPTLLGYGLGLINNGVAKERVLIRCLAGMEMDALRQQGKRFAEQVLPGLLRQEALRRFAWHRQQGHRCVAISASLELYVRPWAQSAGFDDVIATQLEVRQDGRVSGKLAGVNCYGHEKILRLEALLGPRSGYSLYAYGDSRGDRELLSSADYAYYRHIPEAPES
jgi:phosphatidylglycerophosphatase C